MSITTFNNETVLFRRGNYALVEVDNECKLGKRMFVAVNTKTGYTDYPLFIDEAYPVLYDNPERFPKEFRKRAQRVITERKTKGAA